MEHKPIIAALIAKKMSPKDEAAGDEPETKGSDIALEDAYAAFHAGDKAAFCDAMKAAIKMCMSEDDNSEG